MHVAQEQNSLDSVLSQMWLWYFPRSAKSFGKRSHHWRWSLEITRGDAVLQQRENKCTFHNRVPWVPDRWGRKGTWPPILLGLNHFTVPWGLQDMSYRSMSFCNEYITEKTSTAPGFLAVYTGQFKLLIWDTIDKSRDFTSEKLIQWEEKWLFLTYCFPWDFKAQLWLRQSGSKDN